MRQVGRGFNFEQPMSEPAGLVKQVEAQGLVAKLAGATVWALGVETVDIDLRHWSRLRAFWQDYFRRAGADLKAFSPNRRLAEERPA
jgi:hypothetical protein